MFLFCILISHTIHLQWLGIRGSRTAQRIGGCRLHWEWIKAREHFSRNAYILPYWLTYSSPLKKNYYGFINWGWFHVCLLRLPQLNTLMCAVPETCGLSSTLIFPVMLIKSLSFRRIYPAAPLILKVCFYALSPNSIFLLILQWVAIFWDCFETDIVHSSRSINNPDLWFSQTKVQRKNSIRFSTNFFFENRFRRP